MKRRQLIQGGDNYSTKFTTRLPFRGGVVFKVKHFERADIAELSVYFDNNNGSHIGGVHVIKYDSESLKQLIKLLQDGLED